MTGSKRFSADPILEGLTDFQRRTVEHAMAQLHDPASSGRFLVADETGLGKSMVARGAIAKTIEILQDDPSVSRIDVVYVCANADLARQNLSRLNVTDDESLTVSSRLTMLARHAKELRKRRPTRGKPVNLVSFTPGTSFDMGRGTGRAEERAMLYLAMRASLDLDGHQQRTAQLILQGGVKELGAFQWTIGYLESEIGSHGIDRRILSNFKRAIKSGGKGSPKRRFEGLVEAVGRRPKVPEELGSELYRVIQELRRCLAKASIETLEPDLIILDEFQRFRHLLDPEHPAGDLANGLFEYGRARVLLLSATPYKAFSYAEEAGDDHAQDFYKVLEFLAQDRSDVQVSDIRQQLAEYRRAVTAGEHADGIIGQLRQNLMKVMSRAERPRLLVDNSLTERVHVADDVRSEDLLGFTALDHVAETVRHDWDRSLVTTEYWKSAPFFVNFCDGYRLGQRIRENAKSDDAHEALESTQRLRRSALARFHPQDGGNARMRQLIEDTIEQDWWKLLWVPPSLPYLKPGGPYAGTTGMTKMLVFSSWTATPTAVASLLSYEAERRMAHGSNYRRYTKENRRKVTRHLDYSRSRRGPEGMSTLLLFWPMPGLAGVADPLPLASKAGEPIGAGAAASAVRRSMRQILTRRLSRIQTRLATDGQEPVWRVAFSLPEAWPDGQPHADAAKWLSTATSGQMDGESDEHPESSPDAGVVTHVDAAREAFHSLHPRVKADQFAMLSRVALLSPGNVAYRAVGRVITENDDVTELDHFRAALVIANGLRSLFNRPDVIKLIEQVTDEAPYWQRVLQYCGWGNLQSVLDEYLHHLRWDQFPAKLDSKALGELGVMVAAASSLRSSTYRALDTEDVDSPLTFVPRFAIRYGGRRQDAEDARQPEVRRSFNSPFWPFVLASTSIGQEGIDFHWWCHSVLHWNIPPNPVDFEQREGRVDRYGGHAIRRNIAARHAGSILQDPGRDPWARAYELACDRQDEFGDFSPYWVYPGPACIERRFAPFPVSSDCAAYERVKQDVALYRLTLGQPRQETMIELLKRRGVQADPEEVDRLRINLAP